MDATSLKLPQWVDDLDDQVDAVWEALRGNPTLDRVFYAASTAGDFSAVWHGYNIIKLMTTPDGTRRFWRLASALALESLLVNQGVKRIFHRERPRPPDEAPHHLRTPSTSSFPSGHASSAAMATVLLSEGKGFRPITKAVATVVASSRIHVRIHHASDVVAGAMIGACLGAVWKRLWPID